MFPSKIDEAAPVIARHSLLIDAPLDTLWRLHIGIDDWPTWQHAITTAHLNGPFAPGATFRWSTYGLDIGSTVYEVEPMARTLWGGPSGGIVGIHQWTLTPLDSGVLVATEESWSGDEVEAAITQLQPALDNSLTAWLTQLADAARETPDRIS